MTIEEIKQALEAATPLPWEVDASCDYGTAVCENGNSFIAAWTRSVHRQNYPHRANARLIVEAVNNLPALLKVAEAAQDLLDNAEPKWGDKVVVHRSVIQALRKALEEFK
jgi:hypothetical protein